MALVLANRVQETATPNTTVSFTLTGAVAGFQNFAVIGNTNTTYYSATDAAGNWEVGLGTYSTTGPTLNRTTVYASSNAGSAVTFSGPVNVFVTYPSEKSVNLDGNNNLGIGTTSPTNLLTVAGNANITGNTTLGDASTDTVQVNGYMGLGVAPNASLGLYVRSTALTGSAQYGIVTQPLGTSSAISQINGITSGANTSAAVFTVADLVQFRAQGNTKGSGSTITNLHGLYIEDQTQGTNNFGITSLVSSGTNKWNIYASGTANNAFAGNVRIGSTTAPTNALDVTGAMTVSGNTTLGDASTDTVTVNGVMGVGGTNSFPAQYGAHIKNSALTGTNIYGAVSEVTGPATATVSINAFTSVPTTSANAFTVATVRGFQAVNAAKGAGSTITDLHGVWVADQTQGTNNFGITSLVSSGANKWNIYASGTAANYFAGTVGVGTNDTTYQLHTRVDDATTNAVTRALAVSHTTTSTAANGIGSGIAFQQESTTGSLRVSAYIDSIFTDATDASLASALTFTTRSGGSLTERMRLDSSGNLLVGTTTNTNSSRLVVNGTISETVGGVQYPVVSQADIGTAANEIPLNQYLGALAYEDTETPALDVGTGITTGVGTICKANGGSMGGIYRMTILIDLTGLNSGGTAGDIIGVNGTALPCYIARLPAMTVLGGRMTCLETPAGGDTDIDLYSATEGTGVEDQAISALTETEIINAGAQTRGTVTYFSADPAANAYFYLVGQGTANNTYTAGRFLIEIFGVQ